MRGCGVKEGGIGLMGRRLLAIEWGVIEMTNMTAMETKRFETDLKTVTDEMKRAGLEVLGYRFEDCTSIYGMTSLLAIHVSPRGKLDYHTLPSRKVELAEAIFRGIVNKLPTGHGLERYLKAVRVGAPSA